MLIKNYLCQISFFLITIVFTGCYCRYVDCYGRDLLVQIVEADGTSQDEFGNLEILGVINNKTVNLNYQSFSGELGIVLINDLDLIVFDFKEGTKDTIWLESVYSDHKCCGRSIDELSISIGDSVICDPCLESDIIEIRK